MNAKKKNLFYIALLGIITLFAMLPMFTTTYKSGHDTKFHLTNIISLTEQIEKNVIPSGIIGHVGNDFGYGTEIFYPPLAHTSISYMNVLVNNPIVSIKIFYFLALFASGVAMYFFSKKMVKNDEIGFLSAVIYMLFPYHLSNIYIRDAQSETLLFIFLPLILSGLYELFSQDGNKKKFYPLFIFGYIGGMLCHLTLMIYFTFFLILYLIIKYKETFKNIKYLCLASIFILIITSFFYVPIIEHKVLGNYRVFQEGVMVQGTQDHGLQITDYVNIFKNYNNTQTKFFIDAITLILLLITCIKYKKIKKPFYIPIMILGISSIILSTNLFPWDSLPKSFRMMQFPWRFELFVALSVSIVAPLALSLMNDKRIASFSLSVLILLFAQPMLKQASDEVINLNHNEYVYGLGYQQEYMPVQLYENLEYYDSRNKDILITEGEGKIEVSFDEVPKLEFTVAVEQSVTVELPRIYYLGYTLKDDNNKQQLLYENDKGFLASKLESGTYHLQYTGTKLDIVCRVISIISLIGCVMFIWLKK